jgi:hypothetical protein
MNDEDIRKLKWKGIQQAGKEYKQYDMTIEEAYGVLWWYPDSGWKRMSLHDVEQYINYQLSSKPAEFSETSVTLKRAVKV